MTGIYHGTDPAYGLYWSITADTSLERRALMARDLVYINNINLIIIKIKYINKIRI